MAGNPTYRTSMPWVEDHCTAVTPPLVGALSARLARLEGQEQSGDPDQAQPERAVLTKKAPCAFGMQPQVA
jgi:hypothetical protein